MTDFHEQLTPADAIRPPSDRSFGLTMAAAFFVIAGLRFARGHGDAWFWLAPCAAFALAALTAPHMLAPLNRLWLKLGILLHHLVTPVILALLFYGVVMPTGLVLRLLGKRPLRLRREPDAATYWVARPSEAAQPAVTMTRQF